MVRHCSQIREGSATNSAITLTTDFGLKDAYVGAIKGVILRINPEATIVDITHEVPPQDVKEAAFAVYTAYSYFPTQTVHTVVVDPGVGGDRRAIALQTERGIFVAPDNGVLTYVIIAESRGETQALENGHLVQLPSGLKAVCLKNSKFWLPEVSATFHGRDIFAPVAAHLSKGLPIEELGDSIGSLVVFPTAIPHCTSDGSLVGTIIYADRFGNMITDITQTDLSGLQAGQTQVIVGDRRIRGLRTTYVSAQPGQVLALIGSSGHMEIAVRNGSAVRLLGLSVGDKVIVKPNG